MTNIGRITGQTSSQTVSNILTVSHLAMANFGSHWEITITRTTRLPNPWNSRPRSSLTSIRYQDLGALLGSKSRKDEKSSQDMWEKKTTIGHVLDLF